MSLENEKPLKDELMFTCTFCKYCTLSETNFMNHCVRNHRLELSFWCAKCDKCFYNCASLVEHTKEWNCTKKGLVYECNIKECTFVCETGLELIKHWRRLHRNTPMLYCDNCKMAFSLPHCLIMHMQNICAIENGNKNSNVAKANSDCNVIKGGNEKKNSTKEKTTNINTEEDNCFIIYENRENNVKNMEIQVIEEKLAKDTKNLGKSEGKGLKKDKTEELIKEKRKKMRDETKKLRKEENQKTKLKKEKPKERKILKLTQKEFIPYKFKSVASNIISLRTLEKINSVKSKFLLFDNSDSDTEDPSYSPNEGKDYY